MCIITQEILKCDQAGSRTETWVSSLTIYRLPNKTVQNQKPTSRHLLGKSVEHQEKEEILKATREKRSLIYQGPIIELTVNFSSAKQMPKDIFRVLRAKDCEPSFPSTAKLLFKSKGKIKTFGHIPYLRKLLSHTHHLLKGTGPGGRGWELTRASRLSEGQVSKKGLEAPICRPAGALFQILP